MIRATVVRQRHHSEEPDLASRHPQFQPVQTVHVRFDPQDRSRVGLDEYRYR
jgi:hypothetical protein